MGVGEAVSEVVGESFEVVGPDFKVVGGSFEVVGTVCRAGEGGLEFKKTFTEVGKRFSGAHEESLR